MINSKNSVFEKALLALVLISYIHPFMDGNKRTARIESNAILMNEKHCPLSFQTVNSFAYKKAMLLFYEQNNVPKFKEIFINQFEFTVKTYLKKKSNRVAGQLENTDARTCHNFYNESLREGIFYTFH